MHLRCASIRLTQFTNTLPDPVSIPYPHYQDHHNPNTDTRSTLTPVPTGLVKPKPNPLIHSPPTTPANQTHTHSTRSTNSFYSRYILTILNTSLLHIFIYLHETAHRRITKQLTRTYNNTYSTSQTFHTQSSPDM